MALTRTKLILSHVAVAVASAVATSAVLLYMIFRPPTDAELQAVQSSIGSHRCFGIARAGYMSAAENALFESLQTACGAGNFGKINRLLAVGPQDLSMACANSGVRFKEPDRPEMKLVVRNVSSHPVPLLEPTVEKLGGSTAAKDGVWILDYSISKTSAPSWVHLLNPGQEMTIAESVDPYGYGKQDVRVAFATPTWQSISSDSISVSMKVILRATCEYEWSAK